MFHNEMAQREKQIRKYSPLEEDQSFYASEF